jgi:hypothetical protein
MMKTCRVVVSSDYDNVVKTGRGSHILAWCWMQKWWRLYNPKTKQLLVPFRVLSTRKKDGRILGNGQRAKVIIQERL